MHVQYCFISSRSCPLIESLRLVVHHHPQADRSVALDCAAVFEQKLQMIQHGVDTYTCIESRLVILTNTAQQSTPRQLHSALRLSEKGLGTHAINPMDLRHLISALT